MSWCSKEMSAPRVLALSWAMRRASSEISQAETSTSGISRARVMAMQPLPVPISSSLHFSQLFFRFSLSMIHSQSSAVSGRGMSTPGATWNCRPQKSAVPKTYCTGSAFSSRAVIFSSSVWSFEDNSVTLPQRMSVIDRPKRTSSTQRTIAFASLVS